MEKAILKTLIYYDIFNFPLKAWEIHKWLTGKSADLSQVEKALKLLIKKQKIKNQKDYYFLSGRSGLVKSRKDREVVSKSHLNTAKLVANLFKIIPWIKLVGVSGSLSMMGSTKNDDIDLFIITSKNRIWVSRLLLIIITSLTTLRRSRHENLLSANGKICINLILDTDSLEQKKKTIYISHEVLQLRLLWQKDQVYSHFLHANSWAFKFLPNWKSTILEEKILTKKNNLGQKQNSIMSSLEKLSQRLQLKIMGSPDNLERIEPHALYFHPEDKGLKISEEYKKRLKKYL